MLFHLGFGLGMTFTVRTFRATGERIRIHVPQIHLLRTIIPSRTFHTLRRCITEAWFDNHGRIEMSCRNDAR